MALYASSADIWSVGPEEKIKHEKSFQSLNPLSGKISGEQAKKLFMRSNLPTPILGQIWTLSDIDNDGRMTLQEFTIAMHLIENKLKGVDIPRTVPLSLMTSTSPAHHVFPSSQPLQSMPSVMTPINMQMGMGATMNPSFGGQVNTSMGGVMPMTGAVGGMLQPMPTQGMFSLAGLPQQQMNMQSPLMINGGSGMGMGSGIATPGQVGFAGSVPAPIGGFGMQLQPSAMNQSFTLPSGSGLGNNNNQPFFGHGVSRPPLKGQTSMQPTSLDALAIDSFRNMSSTNTSIKAASGLTGPVGTLPSATSSALSSISAPNRLKYTQIFKSADHEMTGYLSGEYARQILIQSNINPQMLTQIWELADVNKDGRLELDEFIIAMHLIDTVKLGLPIPQTLPVDMVPPHLQNLTGEKARSSSVGDPQQMLPGTFEDKRKQNWEKGQMELERRRRELQESQQRDKDERERKEREEEERKRRLKEEEERKHLQELESKRRQQEEMEREQEMLRKKMIEEQLAAQLEVEKKRQREWEKRRKEELLNQKEHEQVIVNELKNRLQKLKEELVMETGSRDALSASYEKKKAEGLDLHAAIEKLVQSREHRIKDIAKLHSQLQESKKKLNCLIAEREKFSLELNKKDSTQTSEALGAIKSSVQQMRLEMTRLKKNLISLEAETATALKESNKISEQHKELKAQLQMKVDENMKLKQQCEMKRRDEFEIKKVVEANQRRIQEQSRQQKEKRDKIEADLKKQRDKEEGDMRKEQTIQGTVQKQHPEIKNLAKLQADAALQVQLKSKDEIVQKQQDTLNVKLPPSRPRSRPHTSPMKASLDMSGIDFTQFSNVSRNKMQDSSTTNFNQTSNEFVANFSDFSNSSSTTSGTGPSFFSQAKEPPPRPAAPVGKVKDPKENPKQDQKEEDKKKADEIERKRLEKEKEEIERLKKEEAEKNRKLPDKSQKDEERSTREIEERERIKAEKEKEDEKKKKDEEVKRKVEEMQRKRMEKKQAATAQSQKAVPPERPTAEPVQQYVKKSMYKMMFNFEARNLDELTISEGEIVQVDENDSTVPAGWLRGTCKGNTGLFPANYASKIQNDNFSDYVDLDPRAMNVLPQESQTQVQPKQPVPQARKPSTKEDTAETMPKLRPVSKPVATTTIGGTRPKSALVPTTNLKALQPVKKPIKQHKTLENDSYSSYDFVVGPATPALEETNIENDLYAVPMKAQSLENLISSTTADPFAGQNPFPADIYQVPGEVLAASKGMGEVIQAVALYPYMAKKDDHLSFNKNDMISVQQQQEQWWFGECNGNSGWFPKSYVKPVGTGNAQKASQQQTQEVVAEIMTSASVGSTVINETPGNLKQCVAIFDYSGQEGDLSFHEGDTIIVTKNEGEWWEGTLRGVTGLFPANYVQIKESEPEIIVNKKPEVAQVITKYTAIGENEISLNAGQLVHVLQKDSNGWWQGELQVRGKNKPNGWFPGSHVKLMSKSKHETPSSNQAAASSEQRTGAQDDIYSVPVKRKDQEEQVLAMFSYTAQNEDELTFYKGSVISVISKDGDWWKGELNGFVGVFPYNYVQPLRSDMQETTSQCK